MLKLLPLILVSMIENISFYDDGKGPKFEESGSNSMGTSSLVVSVRVVNILKLTLKVLWRN